MSMKESSKAMVDVETVPCPLCGGTRGDLWTEHNGYRCITCADCGLIYVNPRPIAEKIDAAVKMGHHPDEIVPFEVVGRRVPAKVRANQRVLRKMFPDVIQRGTPFSWLDVGAGFGEFVEAVAGLAPPGSVVEGIEPMRPKADFAQSRGLPVRAAFLNELSRRYDFVSLIDVFSHVPDFKSFLAELKAVLNHHGELFIKTGNAADIGPRSRFPGPMTVPDELVFAGQSQMRSFLEGAGFKIVEIRAERLDGLVFTAKVIVKRLLGRPVFVALPYTSPSRILYIRARLDA